MSKPAELATSPSERPPSALPPSRLFPPPKRAFDTEVTVLSAGCVRTEDPSVVGVTWIAARESPERPWWAVVEGEGGDAEFLARHLLRGLARRGDSLDEVPAEGGDAAIVVASLAQAHALEPFLAPMLRREDVAFFGIATDALRARGPTSLELVGLVGSEVWRDGARVERALAGYAEGPAPSIDRLVEWKRRQQRDSPPIRRFLARDTSGDPIGLIGYAPFARCDLGFAEPGVLVRLRDVAVVPEARRAGVATAMLAAIAERVHAECEATQIVIGAAVDGPGARLYRKIDARELARCARFVSRG